MAINPREGAAGGGTRGHLLRPAARRKSTRRRPHRFGENDAPHSTDDISALHAAARLLVQTELGAATLLCRIADVLASALNSREMAGVCIVVGEVHGETDGFADSPATLVVPFGDGESVAGRIEVWRAQPAAAKGAAPFRPEEHALLETIGRMVCAAFEHRAAEAALRRSEEQLRHVVEAIDEVFWLYDWQSGEHTYLNAAFEKVWGAKVSNGREIARVFLDSILVDGRPAVEEFLEAQRQQLSCEVRYRIRRPDGTVRWIHDRAFPIRDPDGKAYRTAGVAKDVTAAQEAELTARSGAARLAFLTPRQREVLQLLAEGKSVKEAAYALGRSPKTVETHKAELMDRLALPDMPALVRFAMRHGLVS